MHIVDEYLSKNDWRVKENSNASFSYQGLNQHVATSVIAGYWLNEVYTQEIANAHRNGDLHIHDLGMLTPYCCGWDLYDLLLRGFGGVYGKVQASPPKHFSSALGQLVNFFYTLAGELAGAVAVSNFDTLLAPFIRYDNLDYKQVKQFIQEFVYNMNAPTRLGFQAVFSNLTMDLTPSPNYASDCVLIGGELQNQTYSEFQFEMDLINKAFCEVMLEGDASGRVFTFPIPTYNLHKGFDWENQELLWKMTGKYGVPYFANFINSDLKPEDTRSMCCFTGNTNIVYKHNGIKTFSTFYKLSKKNYDFVEVPVYGGWVKANLVKVPYNNEFYRVKLRNGLEFVMTDNHISKTMRGNVESCKLTTRDYLEFSEHSVDFDGYGTYGLGKFIGLYLAEGSSLGDDAIQFSVGETEKETIEFIVDFADKNFASHCSILNNTGKSITIAVSNKTIRGFVDSFVSGKALDKKLIFWDKMSKEMLSGIWDGWFMGDGKKDGTEAYSCSKKLIEQMFFIGRILGYLLNVRETNRDVTIGEKTYNNTIYTLHVCIDSSVGGKIYIRDNDKLYVKIESITKQPNRGKVAFCFEVIDNEPYFELPSGLVTHNCRLRLDRNQLAKRAGGLFAASALTGSIGVVTLNMPRLAHQSQTEKEFFNRLETLMEIAKKSLELKRILIEGMTGGGLYPYSRYYLDAVKERHNQYWANHFSTIGLNGMHEACLNLLGVGIDTVEGKEFAEKTLDFMLEKLQQFQDETGNLYNLEAAPCESATYRMAKADKRLYSDIITAGTEETPFYTNSTQLPVDANFDIVSVIEHQNDLQKRYTGGTVTHLFLGEAVEDWRNVRAFVKTIAENFEIPYFTLTPTFSICKNHGYLNGEVAICPYCNEETEIYSRVVGYLRPTRNWNDAKQIEFKQRKTYKLP